MPEWIHNREQHIRAKNPSMPESEAWAIATQQAHAVGKSPKGYGTAQGKRTAKAKYDTPSDDKKTADPGGVGAKLEKDAGLLNLYKSNLAPALSPDDHIRSIIREEMHTKQSPKKPHHEHHKLATIGYPFPFGFLEGFSDELCKIAQMSLSNVAPKPAVSSQITSKMPRISASVKTPKYTQVNGPGSPGPEAMHQPVLGPPPVRG